MKTLIPILICTMLFVANAQATCTRITNNGGPNGYYSTSVVTDGNGNTSISCSDPGYSSCPNCCTAAENPNIPVSIQTSHNGHALTEISRNNLSGSWDDSGYTVTWTSRETGALNSTITIKKD